jgi:molybdopterin-containing oxidoreductase family membrane subunit
VAGAIFSGIAALILAMASIRRFLHLEDYLRPMHFDNLAKLLLLMSIVWLYFTAVEHLTVWYGNEHLEIAVLNHRVAGAHAPYFWGMVVCNFVIPFILLGIRRLRTIRTAVVCGVTVLIGMWLERFLIVVGTLSNPPLPAAWGDYAPSWVELSITAGTFAGMVFLYLVFVKLFPIIAIWEYEREAEG